jgi:hypothetical protein
MNGVMMGMMNNMMDVLNVNILAKKNVFHVMKEFA